MDGNYFLQSCLDCILGMRHTISQSEYEKIKRAYEIARKIAWCNERYYMIVDNYGEFVESINQALEIIYKNKEQEDMIRIGQNYIRTFNRRFFNIISSVRLYIDQTRHDLSELQLSVSKDDFGKLTSRQYDLRLGYQIMELLRNYMQHESMVIDGIIWFRPFFDISKEYVPIIIAMDIDRLKKIDNFKNKIKSNKINEMTGKSFNIFYFLHEYLLGINDVHKELMDLLENIINSQHDIVTNILMKYYKENPKEVGVMATEGDFLYIGSYFEKCKFKLADLDKKIGHKKLFIGNDIKGNYERIEIRYNIA